MDSSVSSARVQRNVIYVEEENNRYHPLALLEKQKGKGYTEWSSTDR